MAVLNIVIYTTLIVVTSLGTVQVSNKNHYFILQTPAVLTLLILSFITI